MIKSILTASMLVFVSAVLYSLSQSVESVWFLSIIALIPLMYAVTREKSCKRLLGFGILWGVSITSGTAYWIIHALLFHYEKSPLFAFSFFLFLVALPVGILYGLFFPLFTLFEHRTGIFLCCIFPSLWVISEYIRELVPVFIPWGLAGYAAAGDIRVAQAASLIGVYGLSFITALFNGLFFKAFSEMSSRIISMRWKTAGFRFIFTGGPIYSLTAVLILIALLIVYGDFALKEWKPTCSIISNAEKEVRVTIVQGSHDVKERWNDRGFEPRLLAYLSLTEKAVQGSRSENIVVWPETILNSPVAFSARSMGLISSSIPDGCVLLSGGVREDSFSNSYNSILQIQDGRIAGWYDKRVLLPFAEYTPFGAMILGKFYDSPDRFHKGFKTSILEIDGIPVGASICFESVYPSYIAGSVQRGARILVNVSNDSWFGRTSQPRQHHRIARMRAIEARRYLVRSSNSGISSVIAPTGEVIAETGLGEIGAISASIRPVNVISPYHRHGDLIVLISLAVTIISLVARALPARHNAA